ncbi:hypothetical protein ACF08N_20225 [Streptomyces sp. NPDC015127]|uniref:hypothetical protein n=1 Tax=Streptomyces sp. NPDC015127 TaxID=3364939 RepID=UPI0036FB1032
MRSVYVALEPVGWFAVVPLCLASPLTGVTCALGTTWGLARYYWVVVKLMITVLAPLALLVHMQPVGELAYAAASATWSGGDLRGLRVQHRCRAATAPKHFAFSYHPKAELFRRGWRPPCGRCRSVSWTSSAYDRLRQGLIDGPAGRRISRAGPAVRPSRGGSGGSGW